MCVDFPVWAWCAHSGCFDSNDRLAYDDDAHGHAVVLTGLYGRLCRFISFEIDVPVDLVSISVGNRMSIEGRAPNAFCSNVTMSTTRRLCPCHQLAERAKAARGAHEVQEAGQGRSCQDRN
jgi:hypothetical protein